MELEKLNMSRNVHGKKVLSGRVNWKGLLQICECPVCREYMTDPIRQCVNGHSFCGRCYDQVTSCPICRAPRSTWISAMTQQLPDYIPIPCKFREEGCNIVKRGSKIRNHEIFCRYATGKCPQNIGADCQWEGSFKDLLHHCVQSHAETTFAKQQKITCHRLSHFRRVDSNLVFVIVYVDKRLFRLVLTYSRQKDLVVWACSSYGPHKKAQKYTFEVNIVTSGRLTTPFSRLCSPFHEDEMAFNARYCIKTPLKELLQYCDESEDLVFYLKLQPVKIYSRKTSVSNINNTC